VAEPSRSSSIIGNACIRDWAISRPSVLNRKRSSHEHVSLVSTATDQDHFVFLSKTPFSSLLRCNPLPPYPPFPFPLYPPCSQSP
jgi:hypothetical protein